jgi:hypothetical protein
MSLIITYNKKDISIHQALWFLQNFDFMSFSDKFQTIKLHDIIEASEKQVFNTDIADVDAEDVEGKLDLDDDVGVTADLNNKCNKVNINTKTVMKYDN